MVKRSACIKSKCEDSSFVRQRLAPAASPRDRHPHRSSRHQRLSGRLVAHELVPERLAHLLELLRQLLLDPVRLLLELAHPAAHPLDLLLELEHSLDAGQVHAHLARELLDPAQAIDVLLRVEARVLRRALGADEPARLVDAERLRVHAGELRRDADHVDAAPRVECLAVTPARGHQSTLPVNSRSRGLPFMTSASSSTASFCLRLSERGTSITSR